MCVCVCVYLCVGIWVLACVCVFGNCWAVLAERYGVATVSRIDKIIGLFCKRALKKRQYSAKEIYNCIDPTYRSHPIGLFGVTFLREGSGVFVCVCERVCLRVCVCLRLCVCVCAKCTRRCW